MSLVNAIKFVALNPDMVLLAHGTRHALSNKRRLCSRGYDCPRSRQIPSCLKPRNNTRTQGESRASRAPNELLTIDWRPAPTGDSCSSRVGRTAQVFRVHAVMREASAISYGYRRCSKRTGFDGLENSSASHQRFPPHPSSDPAHAVRLLLGRDLRRDCAWRG